MHKSMHALDGTLAHDPGIHSCEDYKLLGHCDWPKCSTYWDAELLFLGEILLIILVISVCYQEFKVK
jgi:hypothetical protein